MISYSPVYRLVGIKLLLMDEVELEEHAESVDLVLIWIEDLRCFEALTLGLLQEDGPRQEELKVLKDPKVFMLVVL